MRRAKKTKMREPAVSDRPRLELAHRVGDRIEVQLVYMPSDGTVAVLVHEVSTGIYFELPVEPDQALNAFYHPFAYATLRRLSDEGSLSGDSNVESAWFGPRSSE
jgi:hypothetical protein